MFIMMLRLLPFFHQKTPLCYAVEQYYGEDMAKHLVEKGAEYNINKVRAQIIFLYQIKVIW